jgi:hypothetical protein
MRFTGLFIAAALMLPLLVLLHELGHFLTARLVGLEPSLVTLGVGRKLWSGKLLGVPLRIHAWPLMGLTYLGARSVYFLRLRTWITVLMGPVANILLIAAAVLLWNYLVRVVDANIIILWILYNALMALGNLLPHRFRQSGQQYRSDGMQLLQIPFLKSADLVIYLAASALVTAKALFDDADYAGASAVATKGLERLSGNPLLSIMLSACQIHLREYAAAKVVLESLLGCSASEHPTLRAVIYNNLAVAVWLRDINTPLCGHSTARADTLSDRAYQMYPCVLAYRSTRALMLTATNRPD